MPKIAHTKKCQKRPIVKKKYKKAPQNAKCQIPTVPNAKRKQKCTQFQKVSTSVKTAKKRKKQDFIVPV